MTIGHYVMPSATYHRAYSGQEKARIELFFERSNPSPLLFLQDFDWCLRTKKKYPNRFIAFREGHEHEENPDLYGDARKIYNRLIKFTQEGIVPQVYNEPPGYNNDSLKKQVSIQIELANLFARVNARSLMGSWSVGNPDENSYNILKPLFQAIGDYKQILNLHEYGTYRGMLWNGGDHTSDVMPYRVGRFEWILNYCDANNITPFDLFIGEWGIDSSQYKNDDNNKRGYKDSRLASTYANELISAYRTQYKKHKNIIGTAVFAIGNNGKRGTAKDWRTHDVFNNDSGAINEDYLNIMEQFYRDEFGSSEPIPIPPDVKTHSLPDVIKIITENW